MAAAAADPIAARQALRRPTNGLTGAATDVMARQAIDIHMGLISLWRFVSGTVAEASHSLSERRDRVATTTPENGGYVRPRLGIFVMLDPTTKGRQHLHSGVVAWRLPNSNDRTDRIHRAGPGPAGCGGRTGIVGPKLVGPPNDPTLVWLHCSLSLCSPSFQWTRPPCCAKSASLSRGHGRPTTRAPPPRRPRCRPCR